MSAIAHRIRRAIGDNAPAIARVHVDGWRAAYAGLMPVEMLAGLSVEERALRWRRDGGAKIEREGGVDLPHLRYALPLDRR